MSRPLLFAVSIALASAFAAQATPVRCVLGQDERLVEIITPDAHHTSGACEVRYTRKGTASQTLWKSAWRVDFCLEKSIGFVGRLVEQGFLCEDLSTSSSR
jgi:hypothetical protein